MNTPDASFKKTVLIGTFRKHPEQLQALYTRLKDNYTVLYPKSIDFVDKDAEFVKAAHELHKDVFTIEDAVLGAINHADFVWLFAPQGYVGVSAAFEIGYAHAVGKTVYADTTPTDIMLTSMVTIVPDLNFEML